MATYKYVAMNMSSQKVRGTLESENPQDLRDDLRDQQLILLSYHQVVNQLRTRTLKATHISDFCRQMGTMLNSGISLVSALSIVVRREPDKKLKEIYRSIYIDLQQGYQLSRALEMQGEVFPTLMISMIRAAEASGSLDTTFLKLGDQYTHDDKLNQKVQTAMLYPAILLVVTLIVMVLVFTVILPRFFAVFNGYTIPLITRIMFAIARFMTRSWYWFIIIVLSIIALVGLALRIPKVAYQWDKFKVKVPKISHLTQIIYTARFSRSLASLYSSGVSMIQSIRLARSTINNAYLEKQFDGVIDDIRSGVTLSAAMDKVDGFDPKLSASVYIGEEAGRLDTMLNSIADDFDFEADIATEQLVTILQPVMIIILGFLIGTVILSVMLPLYSLYNSIGG